MLEAKKTSVLLVDDEDATRYAVGRMLKKAGFNVLEAANGTDAIRQSKELPEVILLDVNLPDMTGYDVCGAIKADPNTANVPVLHLSASFVRSEDRAFGLNHGADAYLTHPIEEPVLIATINAMLRFRRAEEAVKASEAKYRTLVSVIPGIFFTTDAQGHFDYFNTQWQQYTGIAEKDAFGQQWFTAIHEGERVGAQAWWSRCAAAVDGCDVEFRLADAQGNYRWFLGRMRPQKDDDGKVVRWFGSLTDIDDRKKAEETLQRSGKMKDQFLAVLSHELRTPLTPVLAAAQWIASEPSITDEGREAAAMIARNVELEVRLIDDLLDMNRISAGKIQLDLRRTGMNKSIKEVLAICASDIRGKRQTVVEHFGPGECWVDADPVRLQQVLWNLVKNAVKFTPEGGQVTITTAGGNGRAVTLEVVDTGIGIPQNFLGVIFDAFQQGGAEVTRQFGGMGLGLAISKSIVDLHGGTLVASSRGAGQGASFVLQLPFSTALPAAEPDPLSRQPHPATRGDYHVLLVEDHADSAKVLARFLKLWGYRVDVAGSCADALRTAENIQFDLIISDIGLPDGSGHDLMRALLTRRPIKGIALTGFGMDDDLRRARDAGFTEHLTKPVTVDRLRVAIARVLSEVA